MILDIGIIVFYVVLGLSFLGFYLAGLSLMDFHRKQWKKGARIKILVLGCVLMSLWIIPSLQKFVLYQEKNSHEVKGQ